MTPLAKRPIYRRQPYWSRARVVDALRRYYRANGEVPLSSHAWHVATSGAWHLPPRRPYPSCVTLLKHFRSMREAWAAAGIVTNRDHEDFTAEEHWYIREAAGIIPRNEIARDLRRTPQAVKKYLHYHGLHSYQMHGWSLARLAKAAGVQRHALDKARLSGRLPARRGSKTWIVQPADVVDALPIDWTRADPCLVAEARRGWMVRLMRMLRRYAA